MGSVFFESTPSRVSKKQVIFTRIQVNFFRLIDCQNGRVYNEFNHYLRSPENKSFDCIRCRKENEFMNKSLERSDAQIISRLFFRLLPA